LQENEFCERFLDQFKIRRYAPLGAELDRVAAGGLGCLLEDKLITPGGPPR
jgi:hypothetical protein